MVLSFSTESFEKRLNICFLHIVVFDQYALGWEWLRDWSPSPKQRKETPVWQKYTLWEAEDTRKDHLTHI
jgi:hypothetical protein